MNERKKKKKKRENVYRAKFTFLVTAYRLYRDWNFRLKVKKESEKAAVEVSKSSRQQASKIQCAKYL